MDGAEIGAGSIIGAGTLVTKGSIIPPSSLVLGAPARVVRMLKGDEEKEIAELAAKYVVVAKRYLEMSPKNGL